MSLLQIPAEREGLQKIARCGDNLRVFDVVFVHGLGGDSWTTWMADVDKIETFWPSWLADIFPRAGLWTLGYAAKGSKWQEESMPLADRGTQILDLLVNEGIGERPLVFVTHSMGGIIAKQILRSAGDLGVPRWKAIARQTRGIAFIATPHAGAHIANFAEFAKIVYRTNEHVTELKAHDSRLRELHGWFLNYQRENQTVCRTYCERREVCGYIPLLGIKVPKGILVVDATSAEPNIVGECAIPLDEDHISICKPTSRDAQLFKGIECFVKECQERIDQGQREAKESPASIKALITSLLPADLSEMFTYTELSAWTKHDVAALSLIAAEIEQKAREDIRVIGRGTQLVDAKTRPYITAVAKAILRGVPYTRILVIDPALPQNALLWLLFFERFLGSPERRDSVHLYKKEMQETNLIQQFQIVDHKFLHQIVRHYSGTDIGAAQRSQSSFAISPDGEVDNYLSVYEDHLRTAGCPYRHKDVFELLTTMLHSLDPEKHCMSYHWQLALDVVSFLDSLEIPGLPASRIEFVGCLMPFTFTYDATEKFVRTANEQIQEKQVIALPFRRLDDAIGQFLAKRLSYICVPLENSRIDNLIPPTAKEESLILLRDNSDKVFEVELPVSFVLAGIDKKPALWKTLVAVDAAWAQVRDRLPKNAAKLARGDEEVESNYHAAWLARRHPDLIAVTTPQAAKYFELHVYNNLSEGSELNKTKFGVYSHQRSAH